MRSRRMIPRKQGEDEGFFGDPMNMLNLAGGLGIAGTVIGGVTSIISGNKAKKQAEKQARAAKAKLNSILKNRQEIINPYESVTNLSSLATDTSKMLSNPYASLGVATQAAEIQMEQSDMALANTLDTLRATGASAGGATALAQAALQSKKGVAANIEQQEAQNEKLKAQGEQQLQQQKMAEAQRLQAIAISEGQRVQSAEAAGKEFQFSAQEKRTDQEIQMAQTEMQQAQEAAAAADTGVGAAIGGMLGGLGNVAGSYMSALGGLGGE